ncbi:MAG: hypothetical protein ACOY32_15265 [Thermodesulfobacteriota bacterium]
MEQAIFSRVDDRGKLYVDCAECDRGGNGTAKDKCACGWRTKKGLHGGCFMGELLPGLTVDNKEQ